MKTVYLPDGSPVYIGKGLNFNYTEEQKAQIKNNPILTPKNTKREIVLP